jgi:arylsulfatase A-like enzyme
MNRREFCAALGAQMVTGAEQRPNIVYVLADDLGWGDLGCYNAESKIPTPNFDRVAASGVRFTDMHSPSAVCTPTRYGIMTGRYCWRTSLKRGVLWGYSPNLIEPGRLTVASMLKSRGYATAAIGKWHLGFGTSDKVDYDKPLHPGPLDHGFDYFFGIPASLDMDPYVYVENDRVVEKATSHTPGRNEPRGVFWRPGPIAPGLKMEEVLPALTRKATGYIDERARKREQPFFLYLPLTGPHTPWVPLERYQGKSKAGIYGDFVVQVDDALGQVMQALERGGLTGNTLLIVTSDNGAHWTPEDKRKYPHRSNANWRGMKADVWDGGHRIPFLAKWPGTIKPGTVSDELGCLTDLMSTAAAVTGAQVPSNAGEDSFNLWPAYMGKRGKPIREAIVHHSADGVFSIRQAEWKLALGLGSGGFSEPKQVEARPGEAQGQLFNLKRDPGETENLWLKETAVVRRLSALLEKYQREGRSRA